MLRTTGLASVLGLDELQLIVEPRDLKDLLDAVGAGDEPQALSQAPRPGVRSQDRSNAGRVDEGELAQIEGHAGVSARLDAAQRLVHLLEAGDVEVAVEPYQMVVAVLRGLESEVAHDRTSPGRVGSDSAIVLRARDT